MKLYKALFVIMAFLKVFASAYGNDITTLTVGTSINDDISNTGFKTYQVSGASTIKLYNMTNNFDLYVKSSNGDVCSSEQYGTTDEVCKIDSLSTTIIEIHGYKSGKFSLLAEGNTSKSDKNSTLLSKNDSVSKGDWKYYEVSNASEVKLYNLSNDLDLYVKSGIRPSFNSYDCRPYESDTTEEICKITSSDKVYIGVYGYTSGDFSLLVTGKLKVDSNTTNIMVLDDVLDIVSSLENNNIQNNSENFSKIINWTDEISMKVKTITGKDYTRVSKRYVDANIYSLGNNIFSDNRQLRIDDTGDITYIDNSFLLIKGPCNISYASNSVIFCTGDVDIVFSDNNIIISNGNIEIPFDGGSDTIGSILYTKNNIDVSFLSSSVLLFSQDVDVTFVENSDCINTNIFNASSGSCNQIVDNEWKETYNNQ